MDESALAEWDGWRTMNDTLLTPPDPAGCAASCLPIRLNAEVRGAIIIPYVPGYPSDQIEVVATVHLRTALSLHDGDVITIQREEA